MKRIGLKLVSLFLMMNPKVNRRNLNERKKLPKLNVLLLLLLLNSQINPSAEAVRGSSLQRNFVIAMLTLNLLMLIMIRIMNLG
jgi:hypothetical protein